MEKETDVTQRVGWMDLVKYLIEGLKSRSKRPISISVEQELVPGRKYILGSDENLPGWLNKDKIEIDFLVEDGCLYLRVHNNTDRYCIIQCLFQGESDEQTTLHEGVIVKKGLKLLKNEDTRNARRHIFPGLKIPFDEILAMDIIMVDIEYYDQSRDRTDEDIYSIAINTGRIETYRRCLFRFRLGNKGNLFHSSYHVLGEGETYDHIASVPTVQLQE